MARETAPVATALFASEIAALVAMARLVLSMRWLVACNCLPVIASLLVALTSPSFTLMILRLIEPLPTETWRLPLVSEPSPSATDSVWMARVLPPRATLPMACARAPLPREIALLAPA